MELARVASDPAVRLGKPVIFGTRVTVELLLGRPAAGDSPEQIGRAYPHLPPGSLAALVYAAAAVSNGVVIPRTAAIPDRAAPVAALQELAEAGGPAGFGDPVEWQRETRADRPLPGRE